MKQYVAGTWTEVMVGAQGAQGAAGDWTTAQTTLTPTFTSNSYTIVAGDVGDLLLLSNGATAATVNINTGLGFTAGQRIDCIQTGSGQITFAGTATINGTPTLKLRAQYSAASIICTGTNTYIVIGDMAAS